MKISVSDKIILQEGPSHFTRLIREQLSMPNPVYIEAQKRRRYTRNIPQTLTFYARTGNDLIVPRGYALHLLRLATKHEVSWQIDDHRRTLPGVEFSFAGKLRDYQEEAVKDAMKHEFGVLNAPTGSGKTTMAMAIIAARKQPCLVIVHTKELLQQWIDRACQFLNMTPDEIGVIGNGERRVGERLTIGIVNSIYQRTDEIKNHFGFMIVDECHHCPSKTFTEAVSAFDCRFMMGLSATPWRRDGLSKLIYLYLGDEVHQVDQARLMEQGSIMKPEIIQRPTRFISSYDLTSAYSKGISELTMSVSRNQMIVADVVDYLKGNEGPVLILSDRKSHCEELQSMLTDAGIEAELLTGDLSISKRKKVVERIRAGQVQAVCATVQIAGEGLDFPELRAMFMGTPIKFEGRLIQSIGRVLRPAPGKDRATVYDYQDIREPVLMAAARARMRVYQKAA